MHTTKTPSHDAHSTQVTFTVNLQKVSLELPVAATLLDVLRDRLRLTGVKKGCDHGQCGACTVLVEGVRVNSCLSLAVMQEGKRIDTVEGMADGPTLHVLQEAFITHDAFQCGYCTPGQLCSALGMIQEGKARTRDEIREWMSGNLCRCGAYSNIVAAIEEAVKRMPDAARKEHT